MNKPAIPDQLSSVNDAELSALLLEAEAYKLSVSNDTDREKALPEDELNVQLALIHEAYSMCALLRSEIEGRLGEAIEQG